MTLFHIAQAASGCHVLLTPAWAVWPLALHFWMLRISDRAALAPAALNRRIHTGGAWLLTALLGLVVVKLLLVDLSNIGGAERIITFIAVSVLMLVVGYFAPLPPSSPRAPKADAATLPDDSDTHPRAQKFAHDSPN